MRRTEPRCSGRPLPSGVRRPRGSGHLSGPGAPSEGADLPPSDQGALPAAQGPPLTAGHLQMNPRAVLAATAQVPPFLQGLSLQPLMMDSQRRPGDESGCEGGSPPGTPPHPGRPVAPTGVASAALAVEVVDALHAVLGTAGVAGVGQALIDVALTALAHEARRAGAAVAAYLVHAGAVVKALGAPGDGVDGGVAVVHVGLTVHTCRAQVGSDPCSPALLLPNVLPSAGGQDGITGARETDASDRPRPPCPGPFLVGAASARALPAYPACPGGRSTCRCW